MGYGVDHSNNMSVSKTRSISNEIIDSAFPLIEPFPVALFQSSSFPLIEPLPITLFQSLLRL